MDRFALMTLKEGHLDVNEASQEVDLALLEKMLGSLLTHFFHQGDSFSELMDHYTYLQLCFLITDALKADSLNDLSLDETFKISYMQVELLGSDHQYQMKMTLSSKLTSLALVYGAAMLMSVFIDDYASLHLHIMMHYARLLEAAVAKEDEDDEAFGS
jgi:hypothetical protein